MREQTLRGAVFCLLLGEIVDGEGGCSIFQHLPIQTVSYKFLSCGLRQINFSIYFFQMVQFQLHEHLKKTKINYLDRSTYLEGVSLKDIRATTFELRLKLADKKCPKRDLYR